MEVNEEVLPAENGDAPESDQSQGQQDGLLSQDQQELSERVAHLEKRVREQQDEIACLKGALADVMRRLGQVETAKSATNSILPSRPFKSSASRRATIGQERPKSQVIESTNFTPRNSGPPTSARPQPRGASASSIKKWGSTEDTRGQTKTPRHNSASSQLNHSKRLSTSHGSLPIKTGLSLPKGIKEPTWNEEDKYLRMHLKGRPVSLYAPVHTENYNVKAKQDPPPEQLKLEWVYGYRGRDCRSNLYSLATGEIVYFHAAVVVLHNVNESVQRHYLGHTDDVKCIAIHPDQIRVASGQVAGHEKKEGKTVASATKKPHVRIWDSIKLETLNVIGEGVFQRGVCCVSFFKTDGKGGPDKLLAVDEGNDHVLSVWEVKDKKHHKLVESKSSGDPVTQCEFHPFEENSIVCCGKSQITFWSLEDKDKKLDKKAGIFQKNEKAKVTICFCFAENGDVVSGDSSGNIYVWAKGNNKIEKAIPNAHEGGVFSLCTLKDGTILSGGGKDRKIIQWSGDYEQMGEPVMIPEEYGGIRMISQGPSPGNMILIGTIRNSILQGNMEMGFSPIVEGHMDELWGLDTSPSRHQFMTCGSDRHIYLWDAQNLTCVWRKEIRDPAHCCSIHPVYDVAAVGLETGRWLAIDLQSHEILTIYEDGKEQHECIQFSPDGSMLAVGCRDNYIYIYDVVENGKKYVNMRRCSGHSSFVTHVDWSVDSSVVRSNSGDYEVLYWDAKTGKQEYPGQGETEDKDVKNLQWATQNCTLSFDAVGVWPDGADGTDVNNCSRSNNQKLLASADDYGKVNLYEYPSIQPRATGHSYKGHSSHVTQVRFLNDDSRLISTGGRDMSIMQWQVITE